MLKSVKMLFSKKKMKKIIYYSTIDRRPKYIGRYFSIEEHSEEKNQINFFCIHIGALRIPNNCGL